MKRILVLVFSVLLCLTAVKSLMCKKCTKYKDDKCVEGESVCENKKTNPRCGDLFTPENKLVWSYCAKKSTCEELKKPKFKDSLPYLICCDTDLCNGQSPWALPNETFPESDATNFPEKL